MPNEQHFLSNVMNITKNKLFSFQGYVFHKKNALFSITSRRFTIIEIYPLSIPISKTTSLALLI